MAAKGESNDADSVKGPPGRRRSTTVAGGGLPAASGGQFQARLRLWVAFGEDSRLLSLLAISGFAGFVHRRIPGRVSDVDSFYHLRHAWEYRTNGWFDSSFPWAQCSAVRIYAADMWYGFHLLISPLSLFDPLVRGLYWGAFLVTIVSLALVYLTFRRLQVRWPLFWVFLFALICPDLLNRLTMLRPHPISLGLSLLLFAYLVDDQARGRRPIIALIAAVLAWLQLTLSWLVLVVVGTVYLIRMLHRQLPGWSTLGAVGSGIVLGIFLRPHPIGALHLVYIGLVERMLEPQPQVTLGLALELRPFSWSDFTQFFVPVCVLLVLAAGGLLVAAARRRLSAIEPAQRIAMWASLTIAVLFFILTFTVARRAHEVFFGFSVVFLSLVFQHWRPAPRTSMTANLIIPTVLLVGAWAPFTLFYFDDFARGSFDPARFKAAGNWLEQHALPGEIVFNVNWDRFGEMFFWSPRTYYVNGMDPIFEYAYDRHLGWEHRHYALDAVDEYTCGDYACSAEQRVNTHDALKNDFHASYVVLEAERNPRLYRYLSSAPGFTIVSDTLAGVALYKIN